MNWYIGQEIVCIKTHSTGVIKEGQVFVIKGLRAAPCEHYECMIDVGVTSYNLLLTCNYCGKTENNHGTFWFGNQLFAPLQDLTKQISELLEQKILI